MYNYKALHYPDGTSEIRFYSCPVGNGNASRNSRKEIVTTENPFTGQQMPVETLPASMEEYDRKREHSLLTSRNRTKNKIFPWQGVTAGTGSSRLLLIRLS